MFAYREGGATAVGVLGVVRYVLMSVVTPFASTLADRLDRKRVMVTADVVRAALIAVAVALIAVDGPVLAVYVVAVVTSLCGTPFRPSQAALLPRLATHPGELTAANVVASTVESVGFFAGPAVAGLLLAVADIEVVFAFNALTFVWSAFLVAGVVVPPDGAGGHDADAGTDADVDAGASGGLRQMATEAGAGFRVIAADRDLRLLVGLYCAQTVVAGASLVFSVATALDLLGMSEGGVGLLDATIGVGGLVGGFVALVLAQRGRLAVDFGFGVLLWAAPLLLIAVSPNLPSALAAMALIGLGNSLVDINAYTILQRLVPDEVMGRVFGAVESALVAGMALGSLTMPLLIHAIGLRSGMAVIGVAVGLLAVAAFSGLRRIDTIALAPAGLELLRGVPFFAPLPERALERLARSSSLVTITAGGEVCREDDEGDHFYVIESGEADVIAHGRKAASLAAGDFFGEIALLRDVPRTATVVATSDLVLRSVERRHFLAAVTGHGEAEAQADRVVAGILAGD